MSERLQEFFHVEGKILAILLDRDGTELERREVCNLVVNTGKRRIAELLNGVSVIPFKYLAIGTGTNAPAAGDTALQAEISTGGGDRKLATTSNTTTTVTGDTARLTCTYNFTASFAVTEAGAFDSAASGFMCNRQTFTAINVSNGQSLQLQADIKIA